MTLSLRGCAAPGTFPRRSLPGRSLTGGPKWSRSGMIRSLVVPRQDEAAVDEQAGAGDVVGGGGAEDRRSLADVGLRSHAAQRQLRPLLGDLGVAERLVLARRVDP